MRLRQIIMFCLLTSIITTAVSANSSKIEGTFAPKMLDAKIMGLGGAGSAYITGSGAELINPAGLARGEKVQLSTTQVSLLAGLLPASHWSFILPTKLGTFGLTATKIQPLFADFSYGEEEKTISWANSFKNLSLGANIKFLKLEGLLGERGEDFSGGGYSVDLGVTWEGKNLGYALIAHNVLNQLKGENYNPDQIPLSIGAGLVYSYDPTTKLIMDVTDLSTKPFLHLAAEKFLSKELSLRLGFAKNSINAGIGLAVGRIKLDYAYSLSETEQDGFVTWGLQF